MNEQMQDRRAKLDKIRALGVDPFGGRFPETTPHEAIRAAAETLEIDSGQILEDGELFHAAGRVVLHRAFGNLMFLTVRDRSGSTAARVPMKE